MSSAVRQLVASMVAEMREVSDDVRYFLLPVEPRPASRPKVTKYGTYFGKPYTIFRQTAQPYANVYDERPLITGPVVILIEIVCTKPKTGKLLHPRGDVDNYVKGIMDVMTKSDRFWNDDVQVVALYAYKRYCDPLTPESAGSHVYLYEVPENEHPKHTKSP